MKFNVGFNMEFNVGFNVEFNVKLNANGNHYTMLRYPYPPNQAALNTMSAFTLMYVVIGWKAPIVTSR